ncbi:hypothetical protein KZP23_14820 [Echinicola marina]|uniref:hypothetical protein n=1 Tax=Echinicola marina TaxID=2859768 RepID=UPI001CF6DC88|nr:hypothetical protein [Echinicola marina]UCS91992.1 hypothetical protein KZP23_14820 [Echinicola marina]
MQRILNQFQTILPILGDLEGELIVLSTYFSSKQDPVRGGFQKENDFEYIQHWYESVKEHGLKAVVFYDQLSEAFLETYQTQHIRFVKCQLGKMSLNDERFFVFYEFVQKLPDNCFVLTTDINDVIINKNPLPFFMSNPERLNIGRGNRRVWKNGIWTLKALKYFNDRFLDNMAVSFFFYPVFNPGTIGGRKQEVAELLKRMVSIFENLADDQNYDMQVFNYIIKEHYYPQSGKYDSWMSFSLAWYYYYYSYRMRRKLERNYIKSKYDIATYEESIERNDKIYAGFPFVSMFSWYEKKTSAYLIHK